jgi:hypothetical protein
MMLDDRVIPIFGTEVWNRMTERERREVRHHLQASQISQFMHGEQGALIATSKIVQTVPDLDSKFYAATQVMDDARGVPAHSRPVEEPARRGGQRLCHAGRGAARRLWPDRVARLLPTAERRRAQRTGRVRCRRVLAHARPIQPARGLAKARPTGRGMPEARRSVRGDELFRSRIFSRVVPTVRDVGLWGPRVQQAFAAMGAIEFATVDAAALLDNDARVADEFDARLRVREAMPQ